MKFIELPFSIILEICGHLNARALVSLADVNKELRNLSRSYRSYWVPSVLLDGLMLPVAHRSLMTFSPSELSIATRKALFRESNLELEAPKLYSSNRILWPYSGLSTPSNLAAGDAPTQSEDTTNRQHLDACWIPSLHSNGDWCFTLSKDWILRAVYLRTGVLAMEEKLYEEPDEGGIPPTEYSFDSVDELHARIVVSTPYDETHPSGSTRYLSILTTYTITLQPEQAKATLALLARSPLTVPPRHFDIAGDYAVIVEDTETDESEWPGYGQLHLVDWRTGEAKTLPPLLNSFGIAAFPDYFLSLGVDGHKNIELQVISLLPESQYGNTKPSQTDESAFIIAASIPLRSDSNNIQLQASDELAQICHLYTGRTINTIRLWIRDDYVEGCYNVFTVPVNFSGPPEKWFAAIQLPIEESGPHDAPQYTVEHKRLTEKEDVGRYIIPGTCGRRFFWWREDITPISPEAKPTEVLGKVVSRVLLYSSSIDGILPVVPREDEPPWSQIVDNPEEESWQKSRFGACMNYPERVMECLYQCEMTDNNWDDDEEDMTAVYSVIAEDWSGTVLLILTNGDLIVLRYGHP